MHDAVYWMPLDPLDITPSDWQQDVVKYSWVCQANARHMPSDPDGVQRFFADLLEVSSSDECVNFRNRWKKHKS